MAKLGSIGQAPALSIAGGMLMYRGHFFRDALNHLFSNLHVPQFWSAAMRFTQTATLMAILLVLSACQQESAPLSSAQSDKGTAETQVIAAKSSPAISVDPAAMKGCDNLVATVKWNANKADVNTNSAEVWVGPSMTDIKLFAAGGAQGEIQTGPWTLPGTHFILKNKEDGKVLAEAIVGGPKCH